MERKRKHTAPSPLPSPNHNTTHPPHSQTLAQTIFPSPPSPSHLPSPSLPNPLAPVAFLPSSRTHRHRSLPTPPANSQPPPSTASPAPRPPLHFQPPCTQGRPQIQRSSSGHRALILHQAAPPTGSALARPSLRPWPEGEALLEEPRPGGGWADGGAPSNPTVTCSAAACRWFRWPSPVRGLCSSPHSASPGARQGMGSDGTGARRRVPVVNGVSKEGAPLPAPPRLLTLPTVLTIGRVAVVPFFISKIYLQLKASAWPSIVKLTRCRDGPPNLKRNSLRRRM